MGKRLIIVGASVIIAWPISAQITNVTQCLNIPLSPSILETIDSFDCSTSQTSFLGFVKGAITGDFKSFLRPMSDELRIEECGFSDLDCVSSTMTNDFYNIVLQMGFSNHVLSAFSEINTNDYRLLSGMLQSQKGLMTKASKIELRMMETNGEWRIYQWDVED